MIINEKTKVSAVIKENKDSIDVIATLAKPLAKLKNPVLRKVMAARVTLDEAAKIGGCTFSDMAKVLAPLGFEYQPDNSKEKEIAEKEPDWLLNLKENQITNFDVRKILEDGGDPLKEIMTHFKDVSEGNALCIIVNFEPVPLINRLAKKGVQTFTRQVSLQEFHTFFYKDINGGREVKTDMKKPSGKAGEVFHDTELDFKNICGQFDKEHIKTIDVRALEMPGPRMTILEELKKLPDDFALYVFHKRIPIYLLEDLSEMTFEVHIWSVAEKDVRMLLFKTS